MEERTIRFKKPVNPPLTTTFNPMEKAPMGVMPEDIGKSATMPAKRAMGLATLGKAFAPENKAVQTIADYALQSAGQEVLAKAIDEVNQGYQPNPDDLEILDPTQQKQVQDAMIQRNQFEFQETMFAHQALMEQAKVDIDQQLADIEDRMEEIKIENIEAETSKTKKETEAIGAAIQEFDQTQVPGVMSRTDPETGKVVYDINEDVFFKALSLENAGGTRAPRSTNDRMMGAVTVASSSGLLPDISRAQGMYSKGWATYFKQLNDIANGRMVRRMEADGTVKPFTPSEEEQVRARQILDSFDFPYLGAETGTE